MALAVQSYKVDFARINKAILAKWPRGLERLKVKAWKILETRQREARAEAARRNMPPRQLASLVLTVGTD